MAIFERVERFDFSSVKFSKKSFTADLANGFAARIRLKRLPDSSTRRLLFACPYFSVYGVRLHAKEDEAAFSQSEKRASVQKFADAAGHVYLIELKAAFLSPYQSEPREMLVELPLNLYDVGTRPLYAYYDGTRLGWILEGEQINCDFPFGVLVKDEMQAPYLDPSIDLSLSSEYTHIKTAHTVERIEKSFNFYSPRGYDTWAGDVMNFYHDGVYHLLYLHDRHHHGSRFGGGAHSVRHFTTTDFLDFTEQPPLVEIDEAWKTAGTGTMLFHNGKYYFSYGLHTSRMVPYEYTGSRLIGEQPRAAERILPATYESLEKEGLYPSGANYLVSEDGVHFTAGNRIFHISENPSVYPDGDGGLFMFGGYGSSGIWRAGVIDGEWVKDKTADLVQSPLEPSTECPSMFSLNGYNYLVMGFTGCFQTDKDEDTYHDTAINGFDVYDGLCVPMVTKTDSGRLILSGWVGNGTEWGSVIVHRELIQGENGRLFMKWLPELAPRTDTLQPIAKDIKSLSLDERASYYFEIDVDANESTELLLRFSGETEAVLSIDSKRKTVQINGSEEKILPLYELIKQRKGDKNTQNIHRRGVNFAIGQVDTVQTPYKLKIQLYYEPKSDSAYIDCEIGERRTIVSNRKNQRFSSVRAEVKSGSITQSTAYKL